MSAPVAQPGRHLVIAGPTASGKSEVAQQLAERRRAEGDPVEIVAVDSMQVYRGMDIGTATPSAADRARVPHHLLDLVEPHEEFSVAQFAVAARHALDDIESRGARALLVGGTGLYLQAVVDGLQVPGRYPDVAAQLELDPDTEAMHARLAQLDPLGASRMEPGNRRRVLRALEVTLGSGRPFSQWGPGLDRYPPTPFVLCALRCPRDVLAERIERRYEDQIDRGMLDEVRRLTGPDRAPLSRSAGQALGYGELIDHLQGGCTLEEALQRAVLRTRQFAVRQIRWFGRDPRITWFDHTGDPLDTLVAIDTTWRERAAERRGSTATVGERRQAAGDHQAGAGER